MTEKLSSAPLQGMEDVFGPLSETLRLRAGSEIAQNWTCDHS